MCLSSMLYKDKILFFGKNNKCDLKIELVPCAASFAIINFLLNGIFGEFFLWSKSQTLPLGMISVTMHSGSVHAINSINICHYDTTHTSNE